MIKVFHGSLKRFDSFSYDTIGRNGTSEGIGFYFTNNESIARGYSQKEHNKGYLYTIEFKGIKSLSIVHKTLKKSDVKKFINLLGELYLSNYGDIESDGYNNLLNQAVNDLWECNDSDVDIICSIVNAVNNYQYIFELLYKSFGYDSIVIENPSWGEHKIYIALIHSAYEIIKIEAV